MRSFHAWAVAMGLAMLAGGCAADADADAGGSTSSTSTSGTASKPAPAPAKPTGLLMEPAEAHKIGYTMHWATSIAVPGNERIAAYAILDDLLVTLEAPSNIVSAIEMSNGQMRWRTKVGTELDRFHTPVRIDENVFINSESHIFELAAADGKLQGMAKLRSPVNTAPAVVGDIAVFGASNGMVFGHSTHTGYTKWAYKMEAQILVPAQAVAGQVFIASATGHYMSFNGRNGEVLWRGRTFAPVSAPPVVNELGIFIASEDNSLYALQRSTGEDRWVFRYIASLTESPIVFRNIILQPLPSGELLALKATDGTALWRIKTDEPVVTLDRNGLLMHGKGSIAVLDVNNGQEIERVKTKPVQIVLATPDQGLLLIGRDGFMVKYGPEP